MSPIILSRVIDRARSINFCEDQNIELLHLGKEQTKTPWQPISEEVVLRTLEHIMDPASYPLAIMCHLGRHRTGVEYVQSCVIAGGFFFDLVYLCFSSCCAGTALGCLRKVQRWNLSSIFEEYRRHAVLIYAQLCILYLGAVF